MAKISHIRGMLLEEVLLHLLRATGYRTIEMLGSDDTLEIGPAGLCVRGRGCRHQIDAIAEFQVPHPFSHPQRLLVEAKCFKPGMRVGIEVPRNAVGVLKDVSEFWSLIDGAAIPKQRYHYQYALFSATDYTRDAQRYAFAHDIYLIPLGRSKHIRAIVRTNRAISPVEFGSATMNIDVSVSALRERIRQGLRNSG